MEQKKIPQWKFLQFEQKMVKRKQEMPLSNKIIALYVCCFSLPRVAFYH